MTDHEDKFNVGQIVFDDNFQATFFQRSFAVTLRCYAKGN